MGLALYFLLYLFVGELRRRSVREHSRDDDLSAVAVFGASLYVCPLRSPVVPTMNAPEFMDPSSRDEPALGTAGYVL